jgi:hypothetical protein
MLPKIEHPIHEVYLKSLGKKIKYRPFLVKEEKLLLIAKEAEDINELVKCIKQIITNCCLEEIDVDALPTFDIEMFFLHLRINSIGENAQMIYTCNNIVEGNTCNHKTEFDLELKNVDYVIHPTHTNIIKLNNNIGMKFNYPTLNIPEAALNDNFEENAYEIVSEYLDSIFDEDQVYKAKDISKEELINFFDNLSLEHVQKIKNFFATSPKVSLKQMVKCGKCEDEKEVEVEGILNFFE